MPDVNSPRTWLLIVDPTLKSLEGHSYHYDLAIATAAKQYFDRVILYADKEFPRLTAHAVVISPIPSPAACIAVQQSVHRVFSSRRQARPATAPGNGDIAASPSAGWFRSVLLMLAKNTRALITSISVKRILASLSASPDDQAHVFLPTAGILEVVGIDILTTRMGPLLPAPPVFHIVLRSDAEILLSGAEPSGVFKSRLRRMACRDRPSVRFYTDSEALAGHYRNFTGIADQFVVLPIPVFMKPSHFGARSAQDAVDTVRISMLGPPRIEKGFGQLGKLVALLPPRIGGARVHLAIQVTQDSPDPGVRDTMDWLEHQGRTATGESPVLEILKGPVAEDVYFGWFARTDVLFAPYISPRYRLSTSGVFVEALQFRVPTVTLRGTWMASQIEEAAGKGLKIGEVAADLAEFPALLKAMIPQLEKYRSDISSYLEARRESYSVSRIVELLRERRAAG